MESYSYPFYKIIVSFFLFNVKMQTKQDRTVLEQVAICRRNKLTLYKTQNRESNYVDKFFFNFYEELPTYTKPWGQTSKYYRAGQLVGACIV